MLLLLGMAHGVPFAALAWMMTSVAANSIGSGKLIAHSVVRDPSTGWPTPPPAALREARVNVVDTGKAAARDRRVPLDQEGLPRPCPRHAGRDELPAPPAPASLSPP
ncbi:MAG: hypothetical protein IPK07_29065 [Deltaproteobacteria bacterium]|nr:hypothetical protein [Deltaproteobacteria bacterium]